MTEVCSNGHTRTAENTTWHKDGSRLRKRCKDCKAAYARQTRPDGPSASEMRRQATDFLHEDIEDLLRFGATYAEIIERGGYCDWNTMQKSFKRRGRTDLLEAMRAKKRAAV